MKPLVRALEAWAHRHFRVRKVHWRWSSQDNISIDGLPYVGRLAPFSKRLLTATGFRKWGFTNGAMAASMLVDAVLDRSNPWASTFDSNRVGPPRSVLTFAQGERQRRRPSGRRPAQARRRPSLQPGEGRIVRDGLGQAAVSRDASGRLHAVSARCTHLGCIVDWNDAEVLVGLSRATARASPPTGAVSAGPGGGAAGGGWAAD